MLRPTAPPISADALATQLLLGIGQLVRRARSQGGTEGLNLSQLAVLARLEHNGWMTAADLARAEAMRPQSMGAILTGLQQAKLVRRRSDPDDGRRILFALTAKGTAVRKEHSARKRQWLATVVAGLDGSQRQTLVEAIALIRRLGEA